MVMVVKLNLLRPVEVGIGHGDAQQGDGVVVGSEDLVAGAVRDVLVVGSRVGAFQALCVAKLDGDDNAAAASRRLRATDVAGGS